MLPVTIVVAPNQTYFDGTPVRHDGPALLASHLGAALGQSVPIVIGELLAAPASSLLIAADSLHEEFLKSYSPEQRLQIGRRTVLMDARWPTVHKLFQQVPLAAAVEERDYWGFCKRPEPKLGARMYGLSSVARRAGITYENESRFTADTYALLSCRGDGRGLPEFLAHYLTTYAEMGLHLSG